nr:MAG TPA: hypothetical protein [Caudoviricetes sp.]
MNTLYGFINGIAHMKHTQRKIDRLLLVKMYSMMRNINRQPK